MIQYLSIQQPSLSHLQTTPNSLHNSQFIKMKFFATATLVSMASAAVIQPLETRSYNPCSGLTSEPLCCGTSVDGVLELDCTARTLTTLTDFRKVSQDKLLTFLQPAPILTLALPSGIRAPRSERLLDAVCLALLALPSSATLPLESRTMRTIYRRTALLHHFRCRIY